LRIDVSVANDAYRFGTIFLQMCNWRW